MGPPECVTVLPYSSEPLPRTGDSSRYLEPSLRSVSLISSSTPTASAYRSRVEILLSRSPASRRATTGCDVFILAATAVWLRPCDALSATSSRTSSRRRAAAAVRRGKAGFAAVRDAMVSSRKSPMSASLRASMRSEYRRTIYQQCYCARDRQSARRCSASTITSGGVRWVFFVKPTRARRTKLLRPS